MATARFIARAIEVLEASGYAVEPGPGARPRPSDLWREAEAKLDALCAKAGRSLGDHGWPVAWWGPAGAHDGGGGWCVQSAHAVASNGAPLFVVVCVESFYDDGWEFEGDETSGLLLVDDAVAEALTLAWGHENRTNRT